MEEVIVSRNVEEGKDESTSSVGNASEEDSDLRPYINNREKLRVILHSHKFQVAVIALVVLDCLLVIAELLLDLRILEHEAHPSSSDHSAPHILHYMSIAILCVFIIEIFTKVYAFGLEFFHHKLEVFDAFVIFLSFALDVTFRDEESVKNAFGLVIVLRLWRVARILNGIVLSVKTQSDNKVMKERRLRQDLEQEMQKCREYSEALENEVSELRQVLKNCGINEVPPTVIESKVSKHNTIRVVAEVNHAQPSEIG